MAPAEVSPATMKVIKSYLRRIYQRTMRESYEAALREVEACVGPDSRILDCGAASGHYFDRLARSASLRPEQYFGIEWDGDMVATARGRGLNVVEGDLNAPLPYEAGTFDCIIGLSVLEHILQGCAWVEECQRVLKPGGKLVLLTPNISTWFTAALIIMGRMPSTGPHPDSNILVKSSNITSVGPHSAEHEAKVQGDRPVHRHLVVFSYRDLGRYLRALNFSEVRGRGFGVYPFPNFMQPLLERIDAMHAHQMVYVVTK